MNFAGALCIAQRLNAQLLRLAARRVSLTFGYSVWAFAPGYRRRDSTVSVPTASRDSALSLPSDFRRADAATADGSNLLAD